MDFIYPQQFSPARAESPLNSQILAFLRCHRREESYDAANSAKVQTPRSALVKLPLSRLTVEFLIILCLIGLKVADQKTGCVRTIWAAVVQEVKMALPQEPAYTGLWDGFGGPIQVSPSGAADGAPTVTPHDDSAAPDSQGPGERLNLGSAHYELAASSVWRWTNGGRHAE